MKRIKCKWCDNYFDPLKTIISKNKICGIKSYKNFCCYTCLLENQIAKKKQRELVIKLVDKLD